jgi:hypothetical protein
LNFSRSSRKQVVVLKYLTDFPDVAEADFGRDAMPTNPKITSFACQTIAATSMIEKTRADILAAILGADLKVSMAIFNKIWGNQRQSEALIAAAEAGLPESEAFVLKKIENLCKGTVEARNRFAHWEWGRSASLHDHLLLRPQAFDKDRILVGESFSVILSAPFEKILVLSVAELEKIAEEAWRVCAYSGNFLTHLNRCKMFGFGGAPAPTDLEDADPLKQKIHQSLKEEHDRNWAKLTSL